MVQEKTPGVYIVEKNAFPNSVVEVATAVPAFLGYTEFARRGKTDLVGAPTRISSLSEYQQLFGAAPRPRYALEEIDGETALSLIAGTRFLLFHSIRLFFDNGGGPCWIVSLGHYGDPDTPTKKTAEAFTDALPALAKEPEPTMLVAPDAVLLEVAGWEKVTTAMLTHCETLQSRIAILDVPDGDRARSGDDDDIISGKDGFRSKINSAHPSYGVAYYPWLNCSVVTPAEIDFTYLDPAGLSVLAAKVTTEQRLGLDADDDLPQPLADDILGLTDDTTDLGESKRIHQTLMSVSETYRDVMAKLLEAMNVLPPSAAMAGVFTRIDNSLGVFKAPANTGLASVLSPCVAITDEEQEDLNVPLDRKAVNAIRTFTGRGTLVWGARTLDGNSQDWRYINVRRTLIMLEQSIKLAAEAYVFAPNDASTWITVKTMIENFLNNQWKAGALVGTTPEQAYQVNVGLGSTMTANDILDGYMRVAVKLAVTRPAEFIVITWQQKMQTS